MSSTLLASWLRDFVFWICLAIAGAGLIGFAEGAGPAGGPDWIYLAGQPGKAACYLDQNSLQSDGESFRYVLGILKPGQDVQTLLLRSEDCRLNQTRTDQVLTGRSDEGFPVTKDFISPEPDSLAEAVSQRACYCANFPESITCQPESARLQTIKGWGQAPDRQTP